MEKTNSPPLFFRRVVVVLSVATHHPPPTHERGYSSIFSQWTAHTRMWGGNNGCCHARGKDIFRNEHGPPLAIVSSVAIVCPSFRSLMMLLSRILIPPFSSLLLLLLSVRPLSPHRHLVAWPPHRHRLDAIHHQYLLLRFGPLGRIQRILLLLLPCSCTVVSSRLAPLPITAHLATFYSTLCSESPLSTALPSTYTGHWIGNDCWTCSFHQPSHVQEMWLLLLLLCSRDLLTAKAEFNSPFNPQCHPHICIQYREWIRDSKESIFSIS